MDREERRHRERFGRALDRRSCTMETQATTSNFEAIRALQEEAQGRGASEAEAEMVEATSHHPNQSKRRSRPKKSRGSWERWQSVVLLQAGARAWIARRAAARAPPLGLAALQVRGGSPCAAWAWSVSSHQRSVLSVIIGLLAKSC